VSAVSNASGAPPTRPPSPGISLRIWGIILLVLFLVTSTVGGSLALESSYLLTTLLSHIGLALVTLGVAGYAAAIASRPYKPVPRAFARLTALSALLATIAGTVFYLGGQGAPWLYTMEGFAGLGILASLVLIVVGGSEP
jgi:hypothetical protein